MPKFNRALVIDGWNQVIKLDNLTIRRSKRGDKRTFFEQCLVPIAASNPKTLFYIVYDSHEEGSSTIQLLPNLLTYFCLQGEAADDYFVGCLALFAREHPELPLLVTTRDFGLSRRVNDRGYPVLRDDKFCQILCGKAKIEEIHDQFKPFRQLVPEPA